MANPLMAIPPRSLPRLRWDYIREMMRDELIDAKVVILMNLGTHPMDNKSSPVLGKFYYLGFNIAGSLDGFITGTIV